MSLSSRRATLTLGVTQTIGYASSIYLPATLAEPMARSVGITPSVVFMALSAALLLQVVSGPWIGRLVDRRGGRAPLAFASLLFAVGSAMSAALPRTLVVLGAEPAAALAAAALLGPAQVAARLGELLLVRRIHPLQSGRLAAVFVAVGIGLLAAAGPGAALAAAGLYGAGIGLFTIVRGSLPLALFGDKDYGHRLGVLSVPGRLLQAISPFLFALGAEHSPRLALGGLVAACLLAMLALAMLRVRDHQP